MNVIERVLELINETKKTDSFLEKDIGLKKGAIGNWRYGRGNPSTESLSKLADYFNVSVDYLLGREAEKKDAPFERQIKGDISPVEGLVLIPILGAVKAGTGGVVEQDLQGYQTLGVDVLHGQDVNELFYLRVKGDSMYPPITDGALALVRKQTSVDSGTVAVVAVDNEEAVIKKVYYGDDWITLMSFNNDYPPRHFVGADVMRVFVVGKVLRTSIEW